MKTHTIFTRFTALLLTLAVLIGLLSVPVVSADRKPTGDADGNGTINVGDIIALKNLIMNGSWTEEQLESGDLNGDGTLTVGDMLSIKNIIMSM